MRYPMRQLRIPKTVDKMTTNTFLTIDDIDPTAKIALVRGDLNVPMDGNRVTDATRLDRLKPTVDDLAARGMQVVLMSHFGRPKGKRVPEMSLAPIAPALSDALGRPVETAADCIDDAAATAIAQAKPGAVIMLENLRFYPGEEANDEDFAGKLAALGDVYVNDAFSAAHRAHASTHAIAHHLPAVAGRNMEAELKALNAALGDPKRPVAAIVGGAKVSTKLQVLKHLVEKVDMLIIGGGMANTFLSAQGISVGKSLCETDLADTARDILDRAAEASCEIVLPVDARIAPAFEPTPNAATVPIDAVADDQMILDIGKASADDLVRRLSGCRTLVWNGPMGAFEISPFDEGTVAVAKAAADLTSQGKLASIAGGGDTVAALKHAEVLEAFTYVSTAGGAFLEWMEGRDLPGVSALFKS